MVGFAANSNHFGEIVQFGLLTEAGFVGRI